MCFGIYDIGFISYSVVIFFSLSKDPRTNIIIKRPSTSAQLVLHCAAENYKTWISKKSHKALHTHFFFPVHDHIPS